MCRESRFWLVCLVSLSIFRGFSLFKGLFVSWDCFFTTIFRLIVVNRKMLGSRG
jgi:hypothetical protein